MNFRVAPKRGRISPGRRTTAINALFTESRDRGVITRRRQRSVKVDGTFP
jgi:hypothetical protein